MGDSGVGVGWTAVSLDGVAGLVGGEDVEGLLVRVVGSTGEAVCIPISWGHIWPAIHRKWTLHPSSR